MTNGETQVKDHERTDANKVLAERFARSGRKAAHLFATTRLIFRAKAGEFERRIAAFYNLYRLASRLPREQLRRPNCDDAAQAVFIAKSKAFAPKPHTELLSPFTKS